MNTDKKQWRHQIDNRPSEGFTLVELLVVVAVIGVMAAIAVPSMRSFLPKYHLRCSKGDIVGALQLGKMRAIATGHNCYVDFDHDDDGNAAERFFTSYLDTDDDGSTGSTANSAGENEFQQSLVTLPDQDNGVRALKLRGQVTFGTNSDVSKAPNSDDIGDGIAVDGDRIEFRPNGRATLNSSGTLPTIYMRNDQGHNKAIQVNMLGTVTVYTWAGSGWEK